MLARELRIGNYVLHGNQIQKITQLVFKSGMFLFYTWIPLRNERFSFTGSHIPFSKLMYRMQT